MTSERRCKWCYRTIGEIRAALRFNAGKQPGRIFDRDDVWARCILCKSVKSKRHNTASQTGGQPAFVRRRRSNNRIAPRTNRNDE